MEGWAASVVVVRSLGQRVSVEMVARDFRLCAELKGEVEGFGLDKGAVIIRFKEARERDIVLRKLWMVAGQVLAVEPWRSKFFSSEREIRSTLVWIRLLWLQVEFWGEAALRGMLWLVGKLLTVDECMMERKRLGFSRACVKLDLSRPLRPGVWIMGPKGPFWQRFVYENLDGICLRCGYFHHS